MDELGFVWREIVLKLVEKNYLLESRVEQLEKENRELQKRDLSKFVDSRAFTEPQ